VYAHLDLEGRPAFTLPIEVSAPQETQFGTIKQVFLKHFAVRFPSEELPDYGGYCFWNQDNCPIADRTAIAVHAWEHNDFFLRPLPAGAAGADSGALKDSRAKKGEMSYYYAHDRDRRPLVSKPQALAAAAAPPPARKPIQAPSSAAGGKFNPKQSPFGTNISLYESITSFSWEDKDSDTVKVELSLDGIGKLSPEKVRSSFGERSFELLIEG
ncbi:unnamed protein product, partial [Polarella glacialis]